MKIEQWSIAKVKPYERNPRKNDAAVDAVAKSIEEFGFRVPIVVDAKGVVIAGHTRLKAALKLGLEKVPVHVAGDLTPAQVKALRIADNKLHELASWDADALRLELAEVLGSGFDMGILGFGDGLAEAMAEAHVGVGDPDHVPKPPDKARTKLGDVWVLGDHRLLCGDSSKPDDLDRLLDGEKIHLVNTDPPYNVNVEPRSNNAIAAGNSSFEATKLAHGASRPQGKMRAKDRLLANDFVSDSAFDGLLTAWFGNLSRVMVPGCGFYIWGGYLNCEKYPPVMRVCGLRFAQAIIWVKGHPVMTRKDFMGNHEWCFYGWKEGAGHRWFGPRNAIDVWRCSPSLDFAAADVSSGARVAVECDGSSIGISAAEKTDRVLKIQGGGGGDRQCARGAYGRLGGQEDQPPEHGALDGEARRARGQGDAVFVEARRECARSVRRERLHAHCGGDERPSGVPDGARRVVLRRHRRPVGAIHGQKGPENRGGRVEIRPPGPPEIRPEGLAGAVPAPQEGG